MPVQCCPVGMGCSGSRVETVFLYSLYLHASPGPGIDREANLPGMFLVCEVILFERILLSIAIS